MNAGLPMCSLVLGTERRSEVNDQSCLGMVDRCMRLSNKGGSLL